MNLTTLTMHFNKLNKHMLFLIVLNVFLQIRFSATEQAIVAAPTNEGSILKTTAAPQSQPSTLQRLPPPRVKLNKCCHYGEYLDTMRACVVGNSELWVPLIYQVNRKEYFQPKGGSPKFMTFEENVRPIAILENQTVLTEGDGQQQLECKTDELELFTGSTNVILFSNGSLFLRERFHLIEPRSYCVDRDAALVCFPRGKVTGQQPHIKVKKCCGKFGSYNEIEQTCVISTENEHILSLPLNETIYQTVYGFPECHEDSTSYVIAGDWRDVQIDQATGHVQLHKKNLSTAEYCLEHLREGNLTKAIKIFACLHHFAGDAPGNIATSSVTIDHVLKLGLVISVVFLGATLIASYLMPSVHHVLHWRCQIYYVFSLFVAEFIFAYTSFSSSQATRFSSSIESHSPVCLFFASATHFFFLSAFFWLNTMCFNIWWTFRDFRPSSLERNQELLRLRLYSAYAWGIPLIITVIAASVNQVPETELLYPGFGDRGCWFNGEHLAIFAYFYGPVGILLCANIILFVSTTHQLTCGLWKRDDVKSTTEKTALGKVCLKLVVVMGVTWIADIISWLVGGPHSMWLIPDLINALQGVFLFIVVGCQPQVWSACKRFCCPRSRQEITNTTNGVQHSSSSQGLPSMAACGAEITQNTSVNNTTISANNTQIKIPMETVC